MDAARPQKPRTSRPTPPPEHDHEVTVGGRRPSDTRCPYCHDGFDDPRVFMCMGCQARYHLGCIGSSHDHRCGVCGEKIQDLSDPELRARLLRFEPLAHTPQQRAALGLKLLLSSLLGLVPALYTLLRLFPEPGLNVVPVLLVNILLAAAALTGLGLLLHTARQRD